MNADKHDSFADTEMVDKDSTDPVTKNRSRSRPPISTGNVLRDLILRSNVDRKQAMELDRLVAKLPTSKLLTAEWYQLQDLITEHATSTSQALELMEFARKQENSSFAPITDLVSQLKSTAKAAQPPSFHGTLKDHGQPARLWVFSSVSYLQACNESIPVPFVTSYLRDDALAWWQSFGMQKLSAASTMEQFKQVFLEKYVKPSDSIEARAELQKLTQTKRYVEAYAAQFIQTRAQISLGTSADSSTQARWFLNGLKSSVKTVLTTMATVPVLNDIDQLIAAAIEAETKLSLTVT